MTENCFVLPTNNKYKSFGNVSFRSVQIAFSSLRGFENLERNYQASRIIDASYSFLYYTNACYFQGICSGQTHSNVLNSFFSLCKSAWKRLRYRSLDDTVHIFVRPRINTIYFCTLSSRWFFTRRSIKWFFTLFSEPTRYSVIGIKLKNVQSYRINEL